MAKKKKEEVVVVDELLGGNTAEVEVKEPEIVAVIKPAKKEKILLGYHQITGEEIWL